MSNIQYFWHDRRIDPEFRRGVSLHSHTSVSRENMSFLPVTAHKVPVLSYFFRQQQLRYRKLYDSDLDFGRAYWRPPLTPVEALDLETQQIHQQFQLPALVSITDHDSMEACHRLETVLGPQEIPFSVEWTIPLEDTFLHLGVHNLPAHAANAWMRDFKECTAKPSARRIAELMAALHDQPQVLLVLNHPWWDEKSIGVQRHRQVAEGFLARHPGQIHALELNGFRPWSENLDVLAWSRILNIPAVSGGDRHGTEPNATLNVTRAESFAEFVDETRRLKRSNVVLMPQYNIAKPLRVMRMLTDIFRQLPETSPQPNWMDRLFFVDQDQQHRALSSYWQQKAPALVSTFVRLVMLLENPRIHNAVRLALDREEIVV
jgi:hypothetical protein